MYLKVEQNSAVHHDIVHQARPEEVGRNFNHISQQKPDIAYVSCAR